MFLMGLRKLLLGVGAIALLAQPVLGQATSAENVVEPAGQVTSNEEKFDDPVLYQPQDKDERGLWLEMDEAERRMKTSPMVIGDPELNAYVRSVLCRTVGQVRCRNVRLYILRTAQFNTSMAPNGALQVWSGLLLRVQNEAQLAAMLGHEYTHFEKRHSLLLFRAAKSKSNAASWLSMLFGLPGLVVGVGMMTSVFSFSREMEREADVGGLDYMAAAGYDSREAAKIWERLREEMDATAAARNTKSRKDKSGGIFGTHPPSKERIEKLAKEAEAHPGVPGETGRDQYRAALAHVWPNFVDDQIKLNDFGASDYLLANLGSDGWTPELLYARGELYRHKGTPDALAEAADFYSEAIDDGGGIAELWRGRGLAELKLGRDEAGRADFEEYLQRAPDARDRAMILMLAGGES
jgi:hypothetical protein